LAIEGQQVALDFPEGDAAGGVTGALHGSQGVVEFLHFQQVEDALGFEDAVLLQEQIGEEAVVGGDGVGEGLLEIGAEAANVAANGFAHIDAGFEEDDGEFGLVLDR
jgi:hypothetical protein